MAYRSVLMDVVAKHEVTEAIGHLLDAGIEAPPFLDDQDSGAGTSRGRDEIPGRDGAITGEFNGFSHARKDNRNSHRCDSRVPRRRAWPFQCGCRGLALCSRA